MRVLLIRLVALLAVLLMPLGMGAPAAAAAPMAGHHGAAAGMPMQHCPDEGSDTGAGGGIDQCTMACSAALPALDAPPAHALLIPSAPDDLPLGPELSSLAQDIATPPPKPL